VPRLNRIRDNEAESASLLLDDRLRPPVRVGERTPVVEDRAAQVLDLYNADGFPDEKTSIDARCRCHLAGQRDRHRYRPTAFEKRYNPTAMPFRRRFTRDDLCDGDKADIPSAAHPQRTSETDH